MLEHYFSDRLGGAPRTSIDDLIIGNAYVLDRVSLSSSNPFKELAQPAVLLLEAADWNAKTVVARHGSKRINASISDFSWCFSADEWVAKTHAMLREDVPDTVEKLENKLAVLKEVMSSQGVRIITREQANALGIR